MSNEQLKAELEREHLESERMRRELEVTSNELTANRKLLEKQQPPDDKDAQKRLFTLEQDYFNLVRVIVYILYTVACMDYRY